ncbi:MAG: L-aspartate oxidase [bacterium]|nr:L-aspartate oxidase [bacterium]
MKTDVLVIGSGIAGLSFALKTARALPKATVTVICKGKEAETNTRLAQGGIAVVVDTVNDSFEKHIYDTLSAGDGLCNTKVVEFVTREGPARLEELVRYGAQFDRTADKMLDLAKEGGHSLHRVVHAGDFTGLEIQQTLLAQVTNTPNILVLTETIAIDLITEKDLHTTKHSGKKNKCFGAYVLDQKTNKIVKIAAKITMLASGGVGQVYKHTTNSAIATGDGIAMAHRAGAKIKNMAYVQFHPTALYEKNKDANFLISEAVRGYGGILRNSRGIAFMGNYDSRKDLATRDIVARAITSELGKSGDDHVFLDCRQIPKADFIKHFPTIYKKCKRIGINPRATMIPVVPSAHYCCGGISTDPNGETSVTNLYACGENSYTGLHGANRLASNSLLEALVFSHRAFKNSVKKIKTQPYKKNIPNLLLSKDRQPQTKAIHRAVVSLKETMSANSGITTSYKQLNKAILLLKDLQTKTPRRQGEAIHARTLELNNMIDTGLLILKDAKRLKKNRGVFYNTDLESGKQAGISAENLHELRSHSKNKTKSNTITL